MAKCPTCGQQMAITETVTDQQILAALNSREGMMIYARGKRDGSADYTSWHLTYGLLKGAMIPHSQVLRMVEQGKLVPYVEDSDAGYCTPAERRRWDAVVASRAARQTQLGRDR